MTKSILALGAIVVAAVGLIFVLIFGMYLLSTYNNQADLNNRYEMKVVDDNNEFDNMWKQVSQSYQIADANKNAFKEIFASWAQGSTPQDGGKVMLWIKQAVPDTKGVADIYKDVMNVMTSKRDVIKETIYAMAETAKLFPNQDPIRLAAGFLDFNLPVNQTLEVLRQLAPHFQGDNGDLIRLASGFNDLKKFIGDDIAAVVKKQVS